MEDIIQHIVLTQKLLKVTSFGPELKDNLFRVATKVHHDIKVTPCLKGSDVYSQTRWHTSNCPPGHPIERACSAPSISSETVVKLDNAIADDSLGNLQLENYQAFPVS